MLNVLTEKEVEAAVSRPIASDGEFKRMREWLDTRITRGKKEPFAEVVTLTPCLASLLLERNPANRPVSPRNKTEIKQDIANERYVFNGESIIVSNTGTLNDGQHRCLTVVETGKSIKTVIVFGPKEETRFTIDTGRSKTVANFLAMKGRKYTAALGPAVNYILQVREFGKIHTGGMSANHRPSKQAILEAADELKGIDVSVEFTADSMKTVRSHALVAFCHFMFWKRSSREAADYFIGRLIDGDGLKRGDPIYFCRNKLLGFGRGVDANTRAELVFKCWNAHRSGSTIELFRSTGSLPKLER